jgi:hypothetical protein
MYYFCGAQIKNTTMKKFNNQMEIMNRLHAIGLQFRSNPLKPESINQYLKSNGAGSFILYVTDDAPDMVELCNGVDCVVESVLLDTGFNTPKFPAYKVTF